MICTSYDPRYAEARAARRADQNAAGQPYTYRYTGSTQFFVGQFDFTAPGADAFFARAAEEAVDDGYDGWMEDFGEYTPPDAVSADGTTGPRRCTTATSTLYHRGGVRLRRPRAAAAGALQPLGLDRRRAARRRSSGAATRRPTGASTGCARP